MSKTIDVTPLLTSSRMDFADNKPLDDNTLMASKAPFVNLSGCRILKVKFGKGKIFIVYEVPVKDRKDDWDEYTLKCSDNPRPAFFRAISDLKPWVAKMCEITSLCPHEPRLLEAWTESLEIRGVSLSHVDGIMGATITALKPLANSNAPLVLNTPHKPEAPYAEGGDESNCLEEDCAEAIHELINEAKAYIRGDRDQGILPIGSMDLAEAMIES